MLVTPDYIKNIHKLCLKYGIDDYDINYDGSIDVRGDVYLQNKNLMYLPLSFKNVYGNFWCYSNSLISLEGAPKYVDGVFNCSWNKLTSLEYAPQIVTHIFKCEDNDLGEYFYKLFNELEYNQIGVFFKYYNHYSVWEPEFNEDNFAGLIQDIKEGLE